MPLVEARIQNFRAFADTGWIQFDPLTIIVGRNDVGKSGILHGLNLFFNPPKRKGIREDEIHLKQPNTTAKIEVVFNISKLSYQTIDIAQKSYFIAEKLTDSQGYLRIRTEISTQRVETFEVFVLQPQGHYAWQDAKSLGGEAGIRALLPPFHFFGDSIRYDISTSGVQGQFRGVVKRALDQHTAIHQLETAIKATIQTEFNKIFENLQNLTSTITTLQALPQISWSKAIESVDLTWADQSAVEIPYEQRGAGIRRLFMVAYFQYEANEALQDPNSPRSIFIVEEPETNLHPGAQRELVEALQTLSQLGHTIILTTHSPVLAATATLDQLKLVRRPTQSSQILQGIDLNLEQVAQDLGIQVSDRLIGKHYIILVEGKDDAQIYDLILRKLYHHGHTKLNPDKLVFLQCGGINNLNFVATKGYISRAGLPWAVIADSDRDSATGSLKRDTRDIQGCEDPNCKYVHILKRRFIESYLCPESIFSLTGIECMVSHYGKAHSKDGIPLAKEQWDDIKKRNIKIFESMDPQTIIEHSMDYESQKCEWIVMFENIRTAFSL